MSMSSSSDTDDDMVQTSQGPPCISSNKKEDEYEEPTWENLALAENTFLINTRNPLYSVGKEKPSIFNPIASIVRKLLTEGGPVIEKIAKRTGMRASLIQPPVEKFFKDRHIELFGMLAKSLGLQTKALIMLFIELIIILLDPDSIIDTDHGYEVNTNFIRLKVGDTCTNKSRLLKFCINTALEFLQEQGVESGLFYDDFTEKDLLKEMAKRLSRRLLIIDEEIGLKFQKVKKSQRRDAYDRTRGGLNVLNDGDGILATTEKYLNDPSKFNIVGGTQVLPALQFLQDEKTTLDAMTKKFRFELLPRGNETGDFGPDMNGVKLASLVRGITYQTVTLDHRPCRNIYTLDAEGSTFFSCWIKEKMERKRNVLERDILHCIDGYAEDMVVDDDASKDRDEKPILQDALGLQILNVILETADRNNTFFVPGTVLDHSIKAKYIRQAVVIQCCFNQQKDELKLTLDALENCAANRISYKQADNLIRMRREPFNIAKEVLTCVGWFTPMQYIDRLKRRLHLTKSDLLAHMYSISRPFGSYDFCGRFVEKAGFKVFLKAHPRHVIDNYLIEIDMTMEEYEAAFYGSVQWPTKYCRVLQTNWVKLVITLSKMYPNFDSESEWFQNFRQKLISQKGQRVSDLKYISPDAIEYNPVRRKELKKVECIRGLDSCTVKKRKQRIRNRITYYGIIRKTIKDDYTVTHDVITKSNTKKLIQLVRDDNVFEHAREVRRYKYKTRKLFLETNKSLRKLRMYKDSQSSLLDRLDLLVEQDQEMDAVFPPIANDVSVQGDNIGQDEQLEDVDHQMDTSGSNNAITASCRNHSDSPKQGNPVFEGNQVASENRISDGSTPITAVGVSSTEPEHREISQQNSNVTSGLKNSYRTSDMAFDD